MKIEKGRRALEEDVNAKNRRKEDMVGEDEKIELTNLSYVQYAKKK